MTSTRRHMLLLAFAVAAVAAAMIFALNSWAATSAERARHFVELRAMMGGIDGQEWRASSRRQVDATIRTTLSSSDQTVQGLLREFGDDPDATHFGHEYNSYMAAVGHMLDLISAGAFEQAQEFDEAVVDPSFERANAALGQGVQEHLARSHSARTVADLGTAVSLLLAAAFIGTLYTRHAREREQHASELAETLTELKQTQAQLVESGKLAALGHLVAGIAHEINTPLGAIRAAAGNTDKALRAALDELPVLHEHLDAEGRHALFALARLGTVERQSLGSSERRALKRSLTAALETKGVDDARSVADLLLDIGVRAELDLAAPLLAHPERERWLSLAYDLSRLSSNSSTIAEAVERAAKIVFALRSYARGKSQAVEAQPVDVRQGLETVLTLYDAQIRRGIEFERDIGHLPPVMGHADELVQVWTNLLHNAIQAMGGRGHLQLRAHQEDGQVVVSLTDSGPGVPADVRARIFEPFFTTKAAGEGTGLGLHICHKIITGHGGAIGFDSEPGRTTFTVHLPAALPEVVSPALTPAQAAKAAPALAVLD